MPRVPVLAALVFLATPSPAQLAVPFSKTPAYESDKAGVSTGGIVADLNRDGWPDLVIANGNDIRRQPIAVYYNRKNGSFPTNPDWQSKDIDYHGHLDVGDVNGDGWLDLVVSVYLGASGFSSKGQVKLYLNDGKGSLASTASWSSQDRFYSFSCALGDIDGDGDLDLAVATGEAYKNPMDKDRLYLNSGGSFGKLPAWTSGVATHSMDVAFCDVDGDGDLDLGFAGAKGPNRIYKNQSGKLSTSPSWSSIDGGTRHSGNTCCFGDVDGDGKPDFVVSDNKQLGGSGTFRYYKNLGSSFGKTPAWQSSYFHNGYTSAVSLFDYDRDGDLDLFAGGWWTQTAVFENQNGKLPTRPTWETSGTSVVEAIFFADVNRDGLRSVKGKRLPFRTGQKLFQLPESPVQKLEKLVVDGKTLTRKQFAYHEASGTISLGVAPTLSIAVDFVYSEACDLLVSNWDQSKGNYLFPRLPTTLVTVNAPSKLSYVGGELIQWTEDLRITTRSPQFLFYRTTLDLPGSMGSFQFWGIPIILPGAITVRGIPQALPLPKGLGSKFLGSYHWRTEILDANAIVVSKGGFVFRFKP